KRTSILTERVQRFFTSTWLLCFLVGVVALGLDLYRLGTPSIWFDEAFSVELARQPLPLLWHIIWGPEPNMELYYLFLHFWLGLVGFLGLHATEFVVRFPSAVFAALSSVMVFLLGRRFLGTTAGLVGAGLYILNSFQLTYAQQTRAYSLQLLLICIAWYALFTLLSQSSHYKRWWICYIAATTLAVYSHLFTLVLLLAQITAFVGLLTIPSMWRATARKQLPAFIVSLVVIGILSIPMLLVSLHGAKTGWLPIPHLRDIYNLFVGYSANSKFYMLVLFGFCALGLLVAALVYLPEGKQLLEQFALYNTGEDKRNARLQQYLPVACGLFCWVLVPVVFSYVVSQGSTRLFSTRYLVTILPALFLLVGLGVASLRWRVLQVGLTLALLLIALYYVPTYYKGAQIEDWNSTVHWLQQRYQPGDGLVCYDSDVEQGCQVSVEYYLHAYPSGAHFSGDSPGEFSWANFGPVNPRLGAETAVDPSALAAYASQHSHFFYIIGRTPNDAAATRAKAAQNWLDGHYRLLSRVVTSTVTISWYARV
ncbi:MAG TPA: glycosyltransferase family 39 protein, partial [Ktedonobacteraceae bacterium]|nr:glycosyltransferase family 39 protein [Ktedonobacteraceae bacterium]